MCCARTSVVLYATLINLPGGLGILHCSYSIKKFHMTVNCIKFNSSYRANTHFQWIWSNCTRKNSQAFARLMQPGCYRVFHPLKKNFFCILIQFCQVVYHNKGGKMSDVIHLGCNAKSWNFYSGACICSVDFYKSLISKQSILSGFNKLLIQIFSQLVPAFPFFLF